MLKDTSSRLIDTEYSKKIKLTVWSPVNVNVYLNDKSNLVLIIDHNSGFDYKSNNIYVVDDFNLIFKSKGFEKKAAFTARSVSNKLDFFLGAILTEKEISLSYDRREAIEQIQNEATAYAYEQLSYVGIEDDIQLLKVELKRLSELPYKDRHTNYLIACCASALGKLAIKYNRIVDAGILLQVYNEYEAKASYGWMFESIVKNINTSNCPK